MIGRKFLVIFSMFLLAVSFVSAANDFVIRNKTDENPYFIVNGTTGNIDAVNDLNVGGIVSGDGSGLTNLNITGLNGSTQWLNNGSSIYYNEGNVGIGTSSPSAKLDVSGVRPIRLNSDAGSISIKSPSGSWAEGYFFEGYSDSSLGGFGAFGNGDYLSHYYIGDSWSSPNAVFTGDGKVGIGTITPGAYLDVDKNIISSGTTGFKVDLSGSSNNVVEQVGADVSIVQTNYANPTHIIGLRSNAGTSQRTTSDIYGVHSTTDYQASNYDGVIDSTNMFAYYGKNVFNLSGLSARTMRNMHGAFFTADVGVGATVSNYYGVYLDTPTGSGTITDQYGVYQESLNADNYFAGNIGIGTSTPQNELNVVGEGNFTGDVYADRFVGDGSQLTNLNISGLNGSTQWLNDGSDIYYQGGSVGVGISPDGFSSSLVIDTTESGAGSAIYINDANPIRWTGGPYIGLYAGLMSMYSGGVDMTFRGYNGTDVVDSLFMDVSENRIGIGTETPQAKLHVSGGVGDLSTGLTFGDGDTGFYEQSDDRLRFALGGVDAFIFKNGNQFAGTTTFSGSIRNFASSSTIPVITFEGDESTGLGRAGSGQLSLIAGGTEGIRIGSTNVTSNNDVYVSGDVNVTGDVCTGSGCLNDALSGNVDVNNSQNLDGYDSSFFMPLNKSVYGDFDFNGGWTDGGVSIVDGNVYAQSGYFYDINSLQVTNLAVNGSLIPDMHNSFDLGNSTTRWRDGYFSGDVEAKGFISADQTGVFGVGFWNAVPTTYGIKMSNDNSYNYGDVNSYAIINSMTNGAGRGFVWRGSNGPVMSLESSEGNLTVAGEVQATSFVGDGSQLTGLPDGSKWNVTSGNIYPEDLSYNVGIGTDSPVDNKLSISTAGESNAFNVVDATGNILIGTNTDITSYGGAKLQVRGGDSATTTWSGRIIAGGTGSVFLMGELDNKAVLAGHNPSLTSWDDLYINPVNNANVYIGANGNWPTETSDATLSVVGSSVGIGTSAPQNELNVVGDGNVTGTMYANSFVGDGSQLTGLPEGSNWNVSSGNIYPEDLSYNVGIGTDSPDSNVNLDIFDDSQTRGILKIENNASTGLVGSELLLKTANQQRGQAVIFQGGDQETWGIGTKYGGGSFQIGYIPDATAAGLFAETETMRSDNALVTIEEGGNVGIGTDNPATKLHIDGLQNGDSLRMSNSVGQTWSFASENSGIFSLMERTDNVRRFVIDDGGNVGIGNYALAGSVPSKLSVEGDGNFTGNVYATSFVGDGSQLTGLPEGSNWNVSSGNIYPEDLSYNVGIGTDSPARELEVLGKIRASDTSTQLEIVDSDDSRIWTLNANSGSFMVYDNVNSASPFVIGGSNSQSNVLTLRNNRVAIGKSSANEALDVEGNIEASGNVTAQDSIKFGGSTLTTDSNGDVQVW